MQTGHQIESIGKATDSSLHKQSTAALDAQRLIVYVMGQK